MRDDDNWQRLGDVVERVVSRARNKGGSRQDREEDACRLPTRTVEGSPSRSETERPDGLNRPASDFGEDRESHFLPENPARHECRPVLRLVSSRGMDRAAPPRASECPRSALSIPLRLVWSDGHAIPPVTCRATRQAATRKKPAAQARSKARG